MAQARFLSQMHLNHVAVRQRRSRGFTLSRNHLKQIQLSLFLEKQKHPRGHQTNPCSQHNFERSHRAAHAQSQNALAAGMVELHGPGLSATTAIQGVPKGLLELGFAQRRDTLRKLNSFEGIDAGSDHEAGNALVDGRPEVLISTVNGWQGGHRLQPLEICEPPSFLASGRQTQPLEIGLPPLLNWCQHRVDHDQATPSAASCSSTQSYPICSSSNASSLPPVRRMRPAAITWT